jgi:hypothetical protein
MALKNTWTPLRREAEKWQDISEESSEAIILSLANEKPWETVIFPTILSKISWSF